MTWTFDDALTDMKDQVRILVGDTDETDQLMQDEAITFFVTLENNRLYESAADVAEAIANKLARSVQKSVGSMSLAAQQRYEHYREMAASLRDKSELFLNASPYAGGISVADKQTQEQNTDRVEPDFTKKLFDLPSTQPMRGGRSGSAGTDY